MSTQESLPPIRLEVTRLHRIVRSDPPTIRDFTSKVELGSVDPHADPITQRLESELSMYRTLSQARRKARAFPFLGAHIAVIDVTRIGTVILERTTSSAGHYTLWGAPNDLLSSVVTVEPVEG